MTSPHPTVTEPIELTGTASHFPDGGAAITGRQLVELAAICETITDPMQIAQASRDWWPLALHWALAGQVPRRAGALCRPSCTEQVAALAAYCNTHQLPLTVAAGRSGVTGACVPICGGVVADLTGLSGVIGVDTLSGVVEVLPGTFGPDLEDELRRTHGLTVGHYPQSFDISTVGGWVACRGAGQYSTRYGKIEAMVVGLEVVLADGSVVTTGGAPAAATGTDLTAMFVGSEGTLGIITRVWLRAHPLAPAERRAAYGLSSFATGIEACRQVLRRGATPAVLRLYDADESQRSHGGDGHQCVLLVLDEGEPLLIDAVMQLIAEVCLGLSALPLEAALVERWMHHRNDTSALQVLTHKGFAVDTIEIAAPWSRLESIVDNVRAALLAVPTARSATCHLSHSYLDGACLYFTFAATPAADQIEATYVALWDAGQRAVLSSGGNLSHHHGIGMNRSRFMAEALGSAFDVLQSIKGALDPVGILNPGKLGLATPFLAPRWP